MRVFKPLSELRMDNWKADEDVRTGKGDRPVWRYYGQSRAFLFPLERVCGAEKEIDAMRRTGAGALQARVSALQIVAAVLVLFGFLWV
jgi:hypothetical protein